MKRFINLFIFLFLFTACVTGLAGEKPVSSTSSTKILKDVIDQYWELMLKDDIFLRQKYGGKIERLPLFSFEERTAHIREVRSLLKKLQQVEPRELTHDEELSLEILEWQLDNDLESYQFFWYYIPIAPQISPFPWNNQFFSEFQFKETEDLKVYLRLLEQYPRFIEEVIFILKQQYQKKIILPKPALEVMIPYLEALIQPAEKNVLYISGDRLPGIGPGEGKDFREKVSGIITTRINPLLKQMKDFVKGEYFKKAPQRVGLWQYPQGTAYYKSLVKYHTSLDLTPEEVHRIGFNQVDLLEKKLDKIREELKFQGDRAAFIHFLKTDPEFHAKSVQALEEKFIFYKERAESKLDMFFSKKPRAGCGIKRLDPLLESTFTGGYYQVPTAWDTKGYYVYNVSNLVKDTLVTAAPLILHELIPGHHFQIALQTENKALPLFRREIVFTSYAEGWAEYAADLGEEMGIYNDPYVRCGWIMWNLFMAARLVVDTGMNYYKWPRQKAMDFIKQHYPLLSDAGIKSETLRYSTAQPGQALAYKIGNIKIWELRQKAEKVLGDQFDIRAFHDAVLDRGAMPLSVLEKHIQWFIEGTGGTGELLLRPLFSSNNGK